VLGECFPEFSALCAHLPVRLALVWIESISLCEDPLAIFFVLFNPDLAVEGAWRVPREGEVALFLYLPMLYDPPLSLFSFFRGPGHPLPGPRTCSSDVSRFVGLGGFCLGDLRLDAAFPPLSGPIVALNLSSVRLVFGFGPSALLFFYGDHRAVFFRPVAPTCWGRPLLARRLYLLFVSVPLHRSSPPLFSWDEMFQCRDRPTVNLF